MTTIGLRAETIGSGWVGGTGYSPISLSSPMTSPCRDPTSRMASTTPGMKLLRSIVSCRIESVWPCPPKSTSWRATSPGSRTECTCTPLDNRTARPVEARQLRLAAGRDGSLSSCRSDQLGSPERRPARRISLLVVMKLDDLGMREVLRRARREIHHQHRPDREVGREEQRGFRGAAVCAISTSFDSVRPVVPTTQSMPRASAMRRLASTTEGWVKSTMTSGSALLDGVGELGAADDGRTVCAGRLLDVPRRPDPPPRPLPFPSAARRRGRPLGPSCRRRRQQAPGSCEFLLGERSQPGECRDTGPRRTGRRSRVSSARPERGSRTRLTSSIVTAFSRSITSSADKTSVSVTSARPILHHARTRGLGREHQMTGRGLLGAVEFLLSHAIRGDVGELRLDEPEDELGVVRVVPTYTQNSPVSW